MRLTLILTTAVLLSACGGGGSGGGGSSAQSTKSVFSKWTSSTGEIVDLTGGSFDYPLTINVALKTGAVCETNLTIAGDNSSGTYIFSNATWIGGGSASDCSEVDGSGTYTDSNNTLTTCSKTTSAPCEAFN